MVAQFLIMILAIFVLFGNEKTLRMILVLFSKINFYKYVDLLLKTFLFRPNSEKMLNFSLFTIELNEDEPGIAPTDSRLRPDRRVLEDLKLDEANEVKVFPLL